MQENKSILKFLLLLIFIGYGIIQLRHIHLDFWNDELYSLRCFTLEGIWTTITDYHVPNNHVFYNLINSIYLKLIGLQDLFDLMDHPWALRILGLVYSIVTIVFVFRIGKLIGGWHLGLLAAILLVSNIAYINMALQARGYGLSTMLDWMMVYYGLVCLKTNKSKNQIPIVVLTALAFYTIPLNVYFFMSIIIFIGFRSFVRYRFDLKEYINDSSWYWAVAILYGIGLGVTFYIPILDEVFFNKYVHSSQWFNWVILNHVAPSVLLHFVSARWLIFIAALMGYIYAQGTRREGFSEYFWLFLSILLFPFLISFLRGDAAPYRVFANLAPALDLLMAIGLYYAYTYLQKRGCRFEHLLLVLLFGLGVHLFFQFKKIDHHILQDIRTQGHGHNLYYNFYLSHYHPNAEIQFLKDSIDPNIPFVIIRGSEPHGLPYYLEKHGIPNLSKATIPELFEEHDSLILFSFHPLNFCMRYEKNHPEIACQILSPKLNYNTIIRISKK